MVKWLRITLVKWHCMAVYSTCLWLHFVSVWFSCDFSFEQTWNHDWTLFLAMTFEGSYTLINKVQLNNTFAVQSWISAEIFGTAPTHPEGHGWFNCKVVKRLPFSVFVKKRLHFELVSWRSDYTLSDSFTSAVNMASGWQSWLASTHCMWHRWWLFQPQGFWQAACGAFHTNTVLSKKAACVQWKLQFVVVQFNTRWNGSQQQPFVVV